MVSEAASLRHSNWGYRPDYANGLVPPSHKEARDLPDASSVVRPYLPRISLDLPAVGQNCTAGSASHRIPPTRNQVPAPQARSTTPFESATRTRTAINSPVGEIWISVISPRGPPRTPHGP